MSEFEFQYASLAPASVAEAMHAAGVDGGVPSHHDAAEPEAADHGADWHDRRGC